MNGWKVVALIFIILFVLESFFLLWAWDLGATAINRENECLANICSGYGSYYYDDANNMCYCYEGGDIEYQEYMGGTK